MGVRPPITWFGGKSRLAEKIIQHFTEHQTYCEPFGGSAAVLLAQPSSNIEVYNDVNGDLVNLFCVLRDPTLSKQLHAYLEDTFYAQDEFDLAKEYTDEPIERARRFMVRQRQSYGGLGKKWSYSIKNSVGGKASTIRRWDIGLERLPLVHKRFKDVQIVRNDWKKVISTFDGRETLFYLDPPYVPDTRVNGQYPNELTQNDHHELVDYLITELKGMVVLSGYEHEAYRSLESVGWVRKDYDVPAHTSDSRGRRTECLWLSPSIIAAARFEVVNIDQGDLFISPAERMQQGAYQTHQIRVKSTEAKLIYAIRKMRQSGQRVTMTAIASQARMSREHLGRKYKHLFEM